MRSGITLAMQITVKAALLREREQMRKRRYMEEFRTIYSDNLCPVCNRRHMTGVVCRRHRGSVCEKHCLTCKYHVPIYWKCTYRETEPIDMREWQLIFSHSNKELLWRGIYRRILIRSDKTVPAVALKKDDPVWVAAVRRAEDAVARRTVPKYAIGDTQDENGDYAVIDTDTGEIMPFVVKFLVHTNVWACVRYMDAGA